MKRFALILLAIGLLGGCASNNDSPNELVNADVAELYEDAASAMARGDWETATRDLESLQAQYPFGIYATQAQLDIIYVYYRAGDVASTVAAAERFRRINPRHRAVPYTWYMQGLALEEKNQDTIKRMVGIDNTLRDPVPRRQSFDAYATLVEDYPDSEYVERARERLNALFGEGARFQLSVAQFYADRDAWVAAAGRAITVINEFPDTPAVAPAMDLLANAYRNLGLNELADGVIAEKATLPSRGGEGVPQMPGIYEGEEIDVPPAPRPDEAPQREAPEPPSNVL
ncbi:outer membrane protein assembly factor BamD [Spiribacter insolitus]|uniref:Outer membrane protein assembly factor BamD n=1 Tax=Spiribacter insolitus TaxID=3122417 RepID=A0ABV3T769_9GAMM